MTRSPRLGARDPARFEAGLRRVAGVIAFALLLGNLGPIRAFGQGAGADFAARFARALLAGPAAQDGLWAPASRDTSRRMLDLRTASLFEWTDVAVADLGTLPLAPAASGAERAAVDLRVTGTATWRPRAWGIAESFWTLQSDEARESGRVVRREQWALERRSDRWLAVERRPLGLVEVVSARLVVDIHPSQDVLLVEGAYYIRALADSLRAVRFLVDRRASFYDFRVDGARVRVVRGNELGSLGLEGFSPELESSIEFPRPLAAGEEALITFRLRSPLVHMSGQGFVTSVPCRAGPFRERLWIPVFAPARAAGPDASRIDLTLRWEGDDFDRAALCGAFPGDLPIARDDEASSARAEWTGALHDVDFLLLARGARAESSGLEIRWIGERADLLARLERTDAPVPGVLAAGRRERNSVIRPLLDASYAASQDFSTELQELLPIDDDLLNEMSDESATDAESGADDRSAN